MKLSFLSSFFRVGGALPTSYFVMAAVILTIIIVKSKKEHDAKQKSLRQLFLYFATFCLILTVNCVVAVMKYRFYDMAYFCNMLMSKCYLLTTLLFIPLMQQSCFIERTRRTFILALCAYLMTICIADMSFVHISAYWTMTAFEYFVVAVNFIVYAVLLSILLKKNRKSPFFGSKSTVAELLIAVFSVLLFNYLYAFYMMAGNKLDVMYFISTVNIIIQIAIALRIIIGVPPFIVNMDNEELPYRILPELNEDAVPYSDTHIEGRLCGYFESEKPYLSPDLSIGEVAEKLFTNKTYLSKIINVNLEKNFNEFVNHYRVREAMRLYIDNMEIPLKDLCMLSGFRNIASFTSAFKVHAGKTPGEWCRNTKKNKNAGKSKWNNT